MSPPSLPPSLVLPCSLVVVSGAISSVSTKEGAEDDRSFSTEEVLALLRFLLARSEAGREDWNMRAEGDGGGVRDA